MKRVGRYFLPNLLTVSICFWLISGLMGNHIFESIGPDVKQGQQQTTEEAASNFDHELDVMNDDTVRQLNEMLEEEEAGLMLSVVGSGLDFSRNTNSEAFSTTAAMAGMALVTESLEKEDLNDYAMELLNEAVREESDAEATDTETDNHTDTDENTDSTEAEWTSFELLFADKVMANPAKLTAEALNVREQPSTEAAVVGKLYAGAWAVVVGTDESGEWIQIQSGNVSGWIFSELTVSGKEAAALTRQEGYGFYRVQILAERLNVRSAADVNADCIGQLLQNEVYYVEEEALLGAWVCVNYRGTQGYVSAEYTDVQYTMNAAMTLEEEQAWLEEQQRKARDNQVAQAIDASASRGGTNRGITYIGYEDAYLLACVVEMEAGGEGYDCKLAVANVLLNRYYSRIWGYSFKEIVYSPGQFTGANTGLLASYMAAGPSSASMQAVYDACAGYNNVGGYMFFCSLGKVDSVNSAGGIYIGRAYFYVQG